MALMDASGQVVMRPDPKSLLKDQPKKRGIYWNTLTWQSRNVPNDMHIYNKTTYNKKKKNVEQ